MPTITPQARAQVTGMTEDSYRAPVKTIIAANTGMNIEKAPMLGQPDVIKKSQDATASKQEVTLSPQLSALARKEAIIRKQEMALKQERESLAAQQAELKSLSGVKEKLTAKDFSVLDELGVSYEEWTNYLLSKGQGSTPESQALKGIEQKLQNLEKTQQESINKQYEATVGQYKAEIANLISNDPEFISIKEKKAEAHVLQHILDTFQEEGEVLTVKQAAKEVEDFIVQEAFEYQSLTKVKPKIEQQVAAQKSTLPPPKTGLRTLTNTIAPQTPEKKFPQFQHLSMRERIELAMQKAQKG